MMWILYALTMIAVPFVGLGPAILGAGVVVTVVFTVHTGLQEKQRGTNEH